jgi:thiamine biosynthesis lipoprotein
LVNLWGFGFDNESEVDAGKVDSIREFVGIDKINYSDGKLIKSDERVMLDCSAIAKGFGVDEIGKFLESKGIANYMVEIGGEVRTKGYNPNGVRWRIGINKPDDDALSVNNEIEQVIELTDISVATSGNYRNFYIKDNKKYAHTIDPRTGYPVQHNILSSTVLATDCSTADAYATAFMVLGLEASQKVLEKNPEVKAYFIYSIDSVNTGIWYSPSLKDIIKK